MTDRYEYAPIEEHGLLVTCARPRSRDPTGGSTGSAPPRFDSPSVFRSLLDPDGWHWTIAPTGQARSRQVHLPDSNVLVTRFLATSGLLEVQDCMPVLAAHDADHRQRLVRRVTAVGGSLRMRVPIAPRFDYGRLRSARPYQKNEG